MAPATTTYTLTALCKALGKSQLYIHHTQKALGLKHSNGHEYSRGYMSFLAKVIALRTTGIKQEKITELFELEKKILTLLNIDSLSASETWYLDAGCASSNRTLLLIGFDVGFSLGGSIQPGLDFGGEQEEMFKGHEMGEDLHRILATYVERRNDMLKSAVNEVPAIRAHLAIVEKLAKSTEQ